LHSHTLSSSIRSLHKRERERTPVQFAEYLISKTRYLFGSQRSLIAALWCAPDSYYFQYDNVIVYDETRNAHTYDGPYPIIAHPPCGPWGKLRYFSDEDCEHGLKAMELVHRWGGVVEQPKGSQLFVQYGRGGAIEEVNQGDYGHRARKPTLLYWYVPPRITHWVDQVHLEPVPKRHFIETWISGRPSYLGSPS